VLATTGPGTPGGGGGGETIVAGEEGELLVHYPIGSGPFPVVLYMHPTHGLFFSGWAAQNGDMLRLLASRGLVVVSPVRVGSMGGVDAAAPILGVLLPGAQNSAAVIEQRVYPRLQAFILHALMQVCRRSEEDATFFAPLYGTLDTTHVAIMGFSSGAVLAVYAAEESQRTWPARVRAVVALAPTVDFEQYDSRATDLKVPLLLTAGRNDGMGGLAGMLVVGNVSTSAPRVAMVAEGGTHCHLYIPRFSQCKLPGEDVGHMAALDRAATSAFLALYLQGDAGAADFTWGGAEAINARGLWSVAVTSVPLVELKVGM
jgi:dienelactone hydrolase